MIVNEYSNVEKETFFFNKKLNRYKEALLLVAVAFVGLFGFCYIITLSSSSTPFFHKTPNTQGEHATAIFAKSCKTSSVLNLPCINDKASFVTIHGNNQVANPITFSLMDFNTNAKYIFDFGNGEAKEVEDASFQYTYQNTGIYEVNLKVSYQGKTKSIFSEKIDIKNSL